MPLRPRFLRLEADPSLEFEFLLAEKLGITVARLCDEMSNAEFVAWSVYLGRKAQREELALKTSKARR